MAMDLERAVSSAMFVSRVGRQLRGAFEVFRRMLEEDEEQESRDVLKLEEFQGEEGCRELLEELVRWGSGEDGEGTEGEGGGAGVSLCVCGCGHTSSTLSKPHGSQSVAVSSGAAAP